jgi:hypothetical protein
MASKYLLSVGVIGFVFIILASIAKCTTNGKPDVITNEDSTYIFARQYETIVSVNWGNMSFNIRHDSTLKAFKHDKLMFQGKILDVNEDEEYVKILQDDKNVYVKNIFANHYQYSDIEDNKGKTLIVTKKFYPRERIMYKIQ